MKNFKDLFLALTLLTTAAFTSLEIGSKFSTKTSFLETIIFLFYVTRRYFWKKNSFCVENIMQVKTKPSGKKKLIKKSI
jgi:hypothetical protein